MPHFARKAIAGPGFVGLPLAGAGSSSDRDGVRERSVAHVRAATVPTLLAKPATRFVVTRSSRTRPYRGASI